MIKKIRSSLFAEVFFITALFIAGIGLLVYGTLAFFMPRTYTNELNRALDAQAQAFLAELAQVSFKDSGGLFDSFLQTGQAEYMELYDDSGHQIPLPTNIKNQASAPDTTGIVLETASEATTYAVQEDIPVLSESYYFSFMGEDARYMLVVYGSAAQVAQLRQAFVQVLPLLLLVVAMVAFFASWLYSRLITAPVLKLSRVSKEMSDLKLDWRIEESRLDELGVLEKSLNALSQKLSLALSDLQCANEQLKKDIAREKELEQAQADFFSAASHELKTPITVIKGQLEGMLLDIGAYKDHKKYLARSLEIANVLENMVQELLTVSRLQTPLNHFTPEPIDCIPIIRNYLYETEDLIADKALRLELDMPASAMAAGNRFLMEKVFSNLIGNAFKYSPREATVSISVTKQPAAYLFCVENSGAFIPEEDLPKIFEAFYRTDHSRSRETGGSGLGLYIVQTILQQHGSHCAVRNTENGVAFSFALRRFTE